MTASGARSRPGPTLLALAVAALVLGILGMHGLGGHGIAPALETPAPVTGSVAAAAVHEVDDAAGSHTGHPGDAAHSGPRPSPAGEEHGDGTGGMTMWCVALLAGAAVALVVALVARTRRTRPWAVLAPAPATWLPRPLLLRVGTGPPHVWSFSVIRC